MLKYVSHGQTDKLLKLGKSIRTEPWFAVVKEVAGILLSY